MKTLAYLATLIATTLSLAGAAQEQAPEPDTRPGVVKDYGDFDLDQWVYDEKRVAVGWSEKFPKANEMVQTLGRGTAAYPRNLQFRDGIIECDMAGGAYLGISFRIQ